MQQEPPGVVPMEPPADSPEIQRGNWSPLPTNDPVAEYLAAHHWDGSQGPASWAVARFSRVAYVYRETSSQWTVVAKFYAAKTGASAEKYASREFECIQQARAGGLANGDVRAIRPLALWRGMLFLEYVDGLTLEDVIAVRRSRPGTLTVCLERAAAALAKLHTHGTHPNLQPDFASKIAYTHKVVGDLVKHGVLQDDPGTSNGLTRLINRWATNPLMADFVPTLNHGDATTTNFVFPWNGGVVIIDWERLELADPAADLGRLIAEVAHSIKQHGGSVAEAVPAIQHLGNAYSQTLPSGWDSNAIIERARFYRASSTLRIARNGWISRLDRTALVAQAMGLLS
jgi:aminoglycoside phosphotransferase (APT) family kinase protein